MKKIKLVTIVFIILLLSACSIQNTGLFASLFGTVQDESEYYHYTAEATAKSRDEAYEKALNNALAELARSISSEVINYMKLEDYMTNETVQSSFTNITEVKVNLTVAGHETKVLSTKKTREGYRIKLKVMMKKTDVNNIVKALIATRAIDALIESNRVYTASGFIDDQRLESLARTIKSPEISTKLTATISKVANKKSKLDEKARVIHTLIASQSYFAALKEYYAISEYDHPEKEEIHNRIMEGIENIETTIDAPEKILVLEENMVRISIVNTDEQISFKIEKPSNVSCPESIEIKKEGIFIFKIMSIGTENTIKLRIPGFRDYAFSFKTYYFDSAKDTEHFVVVDDQVDDYYNVSLYEWTPIELLGKNDEYVYIFECSGEKVNYLETAKLKKDGSGQIELFFDEKTAGYTTIAFAFTKNKLDISKNTPELLLKRAREILKGSIVIEKHFKVRE